eukprot:7194793-Ditylum_brightwellii.AAC.1
MFGCDITFVNDILHNNYNHQAYKIRLLVSPFDFEFYKMSLSTLDAYPQFDGRCDLLKDLAGSNLDDASKK